MNPHEPTLASYLIGILEDDHRVLLAAQSKITGIPWGILEAHV
jgi:hypothetical protein